MAEGEARATGGRTAPGPTAPGPTGSGRPPSPFSLGTKILGGGAVLLLLFLAVGYLLPARWEAAAEAYIGAAPSELFPYVSTPEGWRSWTPWPDSGLVRGGPAEGPGARLTWGNRELGSGVFTIEEVEPSTRVAYTVAVEGGSMRTSGTVMLEPEGAGTLVTWREAGDLGSNPLMGYWARLMGRAQTTELAKGLDRLRALVTGTAAPGDSAR